VPAVALPPAASWRAVAVGLVAGTTGLIAAVATGVVSAWSAAAAAGVYVVAAALVLGHWRAFRFGLANAVTLTRLVGTCWIAALTVEAALVGLDPSGRVLLVGLATACLILDGVDGRVARFRGEVSTFGARFDVETDALQLACMSLALPLLGVVGWWALAVAGLRYGYLAASQLVPALRIPLRHGVGVRKTIAVVGQVALILALALDLVAPGWLPPAVVGIGLAALGWSFGRDVVWQLRQARTRHDLIRLGGS